MRQIAKYTAALFPPVLAFVLGCSAGVQRAESSAPFLHYRVELKDADLDLLRVIGTVRGALAGEMPLHPPVSGTVPALNPLGLKAVDMEGRELEIERIDDHWVVRNRRRDFIFSYDLVMTVEDRYSPRVRSMISILQRERLRLLGRDIFLIPGVELKEGILADIVIGENGELQSNWECLGRRMLIPGRDDLVSSMAVSGRYRIYEQTVSGVRLAVAIAGGWSFRDEELIYVIRSVVVDEIAMFGSSPYSKYLFVVDSNPVMGGKGFDCYGVHFGSSILLLFDRQIDRSLLFDTPMSIVAHEFFHNWNGELLKPATDDFLWFTEGATVYYSYRVLLDMNIITPDQYRRRRDAIENRYLENPYMETVTIAGSANSDLSDKNMVNLLYDGGFLAAERLDGIMREITGGRQGLIDVLKSLYDSYPEGADIGLAVLVDTVRSMTGHDLSAYLDELVNSAASCAPEQADVSS